MKQHYFLLSDSYKKLLSFFFFSFCLISSLFAQTYVNGNLGTSATSNNGTPAPAGAMWHELQNDAGNTTESNSTLGVSHASFGANNFTLADDFTVPAGETWNLTKLTIYSLDQITTSTTSPYTDIRVRIYNGVPGAGGTVIYGDLTTNRFAATAYTNKRAIFNSLVPTPTTPPTPDLPIFSIDANLSTTLTAGTYWIEWQVVYTAACFSLTSQTVGVRTMPGYNAIRSNAGVFTPLTDGGTPASAPDVAIDLPFTITYNTGACSGTPTPGNTISSVSSVCPGTSFDLSIQNSTSGSGVTYQWQSSPDGIAYTNIPGATSSVLSTTLTVPTWYQVIVTCGANPPATSTPVQVTVTTSTVTTQPSPATSTCGGTASFTAAASGTTVTYQWQQRITSAAPWTNVTDGLDVGTGATFGGATTATLNILNTTTVMNGYQYRASITGSCAANIFSDPATLTVDPLTIAVNPSAVNVCAGNTTPVGIAITTVNGSTVTETTPFASGAVNIPIPDASPVGITHTIPVSIPAGAVITAASVTLNIPHTWVGDMVIALKAPNGNILNLDYALNGTGGGPDPTTGFTNTVISSTGVTTLDAGTDPWTGTFAPDAPTAPGTVPTAPTSLSPTNANVFTFADLYSVPSGNWTLGIFDAGAMDLGTLLNWTLTLTYTYPQGQPYTGVWTPATGLFTDANATIPYVAGTQEDSVWTLPTANGSYTVTVTSSTCATSPVVIPVAVVSAPTITTQPVDVTVCEGANASFTATASGTSYQWQVSTDGGANFTDIAGQTTTTLNLTAVTASMNNNQYRLVVSSCGPTGLNSNAVTLTVNTAAAISTQPSSATVCVGNNATFSVTATGSGTLTYQWEVSTDGGTTYTAIPGATTATLTIPSVTTGIDNTLYHVIITNICSTGLTSSAATLTVSSQAAINTQPVATSACAGSNATFSVVASGPGLTYQWQESTDGGATFTDLAGETNSTLTIPVTDGMNNNQYQVVVGSACSATGTNSDPAVLTVFTLPVVTITASPFTSLTNDATTTLTATSVPASTTFSWFLDGNAIAGATGNTLTVDHSGLGNYTASVTDANGCTGVSNELTITDSLLTNVFVYPNPSSGIFLVSYNDTINGVSSIRMITVYDSKGSRVYQQSVSVLTPAERMPVDLSRQPRGVYILELTDVSGQRLQTARLIKR